MNDLNRYTKTELIKRINELEEELEVKSCSTDLSIEDSIPLESFVQKANFPICHVDNSNGKIKYFNHRFFETFGYTHQEIPSLDEWWLLAYPDPEYREWVIKNWTEAVNYSIEHNTDITPDVYEVTCKNGSTKQIFISGITIGEDLIATFFDLSAQKKTESLFRSIFNSKLTGIVFWNAEGDIIDANNTFLEMFGYSKSELDSGSIKWKEMTPDEFQEQDELLLKELETSGYLSPFEKEYFHKDGHRIPILIGATTLLDSTTKGVAFIVDITEKKEAETALRMAQEKYQSLYENAQVGLFTVDISDGSFIDANLKSAMIAGFDKIEEFKFQYRTLENYVNPSDRKVMLDLLAKQNYIENFQVQMYDRSKNIYWAELSAQLNKETGLLIGVIIDITESYKTSKELEHQKTKLDDILEGTNAGTWDWDIQTGAVAFNNRWAEIMGKTLIDLEPIDINTWIDNVHPEDLPYANDELNKHFNKESDYYDVEFRQPHKDDKWVWVNARGKVIEWSADGKPLRMSGTHIDITERKIAEREIENYKEQLEVKVSERTIELEEKNKELDEALKVFVGREKTIMELQEQISKLKLGK